MSISDCVERKKSRKGKRGGRGKKKMKRVKKGQAIDPATSRRYPGNLTFTPSHFGRDAATVNTLHPSTRHLSGSGNGVLAGGWRPA
jgi:hypothetical protein